MIKRRLILPAMILWTGSGLVVTGKDQPPADPLMQRFESVTTLLREDRPADAERLLAQVRLQSNESKSELGKVTITYVFTSMLLINTYLRLNDYTSAERVANDRITWVEQKYGVMAGQAGGFLTLLAEANRLQGKYKEAEPLYLRSLSIQRSLGLDDCLVARAGYAGLAETYMALKRPRDAEEMLRPVIEPCREKLGGNGKGRSYLLNAYAVALEDENKLDEAAKVASEADRVGTPDPRSEREPRDV